MPKVKLFHSLKEAQEIVPSGELRLVRIHDKRICLVRAKGHLYAIQDLCPHLGHSLHQGHLNPSLEVVCPLHAYRFDLKTGDETSMRCPPARIYPITIGQDGVFVEI